jgi:Dock homology region 2
LEVDVTNTARSELKAGEDTFSATSFGKQKSKQGTVMNRLFLYESIIKSCLVARANQSTSHSSDEGNGGRPIHSSSIANGSGMTKILHPSEILMQTDFLLPLCMKSIVLRYRGQITSPESKVLADDSQVLMLESFIGVLAEQVIYLAIKSSSTVQDRENSLKKALSTSHVVLDFLIGLISVFHIKQIQGFILKYFAVLRDAEKRVAVGIDDEISDSTMELILHSVVSSRKLRLLAAETFASLPSFLALNLPMKYSVRQESHRFVTASWLKQCIVDETHIPPSIQGQLKSEDSSQSGWLAHIVLNECLLICSMSSKTVVEELLAVIHTSARNSALKSAWRKRSDVVLSQDDVLLLHTLAAHAIQIVYELVVRRHALDRRFQSESAQSRIACLLTTPIMELSCANVRWLGMLDSTNVVRSSWLLCFLYVLEEAPEALIYDFIHSCCDPGEMRLHNFIRLLSLCSSTFQNFLHLERFPYLSEEDCILSPWLLQESFNTIVAATIVIVDFCLDVQSLFSPYDVNLAMQGITDLLLEILTMPQSPVTHLRAMGAALHIVESDIDVFLNAVGDNLQHWFRVLQTLMNSQSLSVRSIAVDYMISLLCSFYDEHGTIDALTLVFASVLPEVVSREIALYAVGGHVTTMDDVAKTFWPIRRALADISDAHPSEDTRVDPVLPPILSVFCRACQAVIDGVLVELRLRKDSLMIGGTAVQIDSNSRIAFDADEESVYEVASFFAPETAPMQRIRWLLTLKHLHASRNHWVEAAECLFLCANTICESMLHLKLTWRPSRFLLWSDPERSTWLRTVADAGHPARGNAAVMQFAENFLEPSDFLKFPGKSIEPKGKLNHPTIMEMCSVLTSMVNEAIELYGKELGFESFAHHRWEGIVKSMLSLMDQFQSFHTPSSFRAKIGARAKHNEEATSMQKAWTSICGYAVLDKLASHDSASRRPFFVTVRLYGKKPSRFEESTTIPTFLEWDKLCVCRVPSSILQHELPPEQVCHRFGQAFRTSLSDDVGAAQLVVRTHPAGEGDIIEGITYMDVLPVYLEKTVGDTVGRSSWKRFRNISPTGAFVTTVVHEFPGALSRQTTLVTSELVVA